MERKDTHCLRQNGSSFFVVSGVNRVREKMWSRPANKKGVIHHSDVVAVLLQIFMFFFFVVVCLLFFFLVSSYLSFPPNKIIETFTNVCGSAGSDLFLRSYHHLHLLLLLRHHLHGSLRISCCYFFRCWCCTAMLPDGGSCQSVDRPSPKPVLLF